jgi:SAM-dependent methyltransferase
MANLTIRCKTSTTRDARRRSLYFATMPQDLVDVWDNYYVTAEDTAIRDRPFFELEVQAITSRVHAHAEATEATSVRVLELGSGTGFLAERVVERLRSLGAELRYDGVDFSAVAIERATHRNLPECHFHQADFLEFVDAADGAYDVVITQRSIMAIMEPDAQIRLLRGLRDRLTVGGLGLLSESSVQGLDRLNELRTNLGVEELEKVWHSRYLDERDIELVFGSVEIVHFAGLYWLITRVTYPYFEEPRHNTALHRFAASLPQAGDFSPVRLFAVQA